MMLAFPTSNICSKKVVLQVDVSPVLFIYVWWGFCIASSFQLPSGCYRFQRSRFSASLTEKREAGYNVFDIPHKSSPGRSGSILNAISCFSPKK